MRVINKDNVYTFLEWERHRSLVALCEDSLTTPLLRTSEMRKRVAYVLYCLEGHLDEKHVVVYATELNGVPVALAHQSHSVELLVVPERQERWVEFLTQFSEVREKITLRCVSGDGKLHFESASFDAAVYLNDSSETKVEEHTLALSELYRVVRPRGQMICIVPNDHTSVANGLSQEEFTRMARDFQSEMALGASIPVSENFVSSNGGEPEFQAFSTIKGALPDPATFNIALTRELLEEYLKKYGGDQVLTDLVLFDYWAIRSALPIASSGRINDKDLITSRAFRLWEYRQLIKALGLDTEHTGSILDLGGASSPLTYYAALRGFDVTSLDINADIMELQQRTSARLGITTLQTIVMDMRDLSAFQDNSFDKVMSASVFEHLTEDGQIQAMREIYRVLKPGGTVAISFDYGIPAPGANPDLPPPHEPPVRSSDVYHRYVESTGLEVVGEAFSCVFSRFWDSVNYCPAVIVLRKPGHDAYSEPVNTYKSWCKTGSIIIGHLADDSEVALALCNLVYERTRIERRYERSTTMLKAVEQDSRIRLSDIFTLTDEIKRTSNLLVESESRLSLVQQSYATELRDVKRDFVAAVTRKDEDIAEVRRLLGDKVREMESVRKALQTCESEIEKLRQDYAYLADEHSLLREENTLLAAKGADLLIDLEQLNQNRWVRLLRSLKMI